MTLNSEHVNSKPVPPNRGRDLQTKFPASCPEVVFRRQQRSPFCASRRLDRLFSIGRLREFARHRDLEGDPSYRKGPCRRFPDPADCLPDPVLVADFAHGTTGFGAKLGKWRDRW